MILQLSCSRAGWGGRRQSLRKDRGAALTKVLEDQPRVRTGLQLPSPLVLLLSKASSYSV